MRVLRGNPARPGALAGATREFNWQLIRFTWRAYPQNRKKYRALLATRDQLPVMIIHGAGGLRGLYRSWNLRR